MLVVSINQSMFTIYLFPLQSLLSIKNEEGGDDLLFLESNDYISFSSSILGSFSINSDLYLLYKLLFINYLLKTLDQYPVFA